MPQYRESLPVDCPPSEAQDGELGEVWRFIQGSTPVDADFDSHAKRGLPNRNSVPPCEFASCSLFETERAKEMAKNQFFKRKLASRLAVPASSGRHITNARGHVSLWMYASFNPCAAVAETVKL